MWNDHGAPARAAPSTPEGAVSDNEWRVLVVRRDKDGQPMAHDRLLGPNSPLGDVPGSRVHASALALSVSYSALLMLPASSSVFASEISSDADLLGATDRM